MQIAHGQVTESNIAVSTSTPAPAVAIAVAEAQDPLFLRAKKANDNFKYVADRVYGTVNLQTPGTTDASFFANTFLVGHAPLPSLKLPVGDYDYSIRLPKYDEVCGKLTVTAQTISELSIPLTKRKNIATIKTNPSEVQIFINNRLLGTTTDSGFTISTLEPGQYAIQLVKKGFQTKNSVLKIVASEKTGVSAIMTPNPGSLLVESDPEGSFVYVNNIFWGRTPITVAKLRPGRSEVRIEHDGKAIWKKSVYIKSDELQRVSAELLKDGSMKDVSPYGELAGTWGDKDGDGVPNDMDKCPEDPEDIDGFEDADGCPDPDNDFDGIPDIKEKDNKYRDLPEDFDSFEDSDGAPEFDNDKDNIPDSLDLCISTPEDRDGFEDYDGCPDFDNDKDGIADSLDITINEPEDVDGFKDTDGAQDLDNDNDGVPDYLDACPNAAEIFNNYQDDDGCPDEKLSEPPIGIFRQVQFTLGEPLPELTLSYLDSIYNAMFQFPTMQIAVTIHCDNKGRTPRKLAETQEKAAALQKYLDFRGLIDKSRYTVTGVGPADPIASNVSDEGRAKNTRVDIRRVK